MTSEKKAAAEDDDGCGEFASSGEIRHGFISGATFTDKLVTFNVQNGRALFEGDIVLDGRVTTITDENSEPPQAAAGPRAHIAMDEAGTVSKAVVIAGAQFRWPAGVVPFEIDAGVPTAQRTAITAALAEWRSRTRLSFPARVEEHPHWIRFVPGDGCASHVGRQGGRQDITLGPNCGTGQAIHEIGHAVGLWHEQSRADRDSFITIHWNNIAPDRRHNFDQHISDGDDVAEYDFGSIMHYPPTAFAINPAQPTITPRVAGVTIGQRAALSELDTAAIRAIYPTLQAPHDRTFVGDFSGDGLSDLLAYVPSRLHWWRGTSNQARLQLQDAGSANGFGQVGDGRPFWVGRFSQSARDEVLFYYPGDDNWWLGSFNGNALAWSHVSNTAGFGHGINDGRPFWVGDFNGDGKTEILFYYPGDDNWWIASHNGSKLEWSFAGSTAGFGHGINDGRPFWVGDFDGDGKSELLFYYPGDDNWWLGHYENGVFSWSLAGNTAGFGHGINDGRPFWTGRFSNATRDQVLFYYPGDDNWWLGDYAGQKLTWSNAGNTLGFGRRINDGRPFWIGDFNGDGRSEVLFYYPGDNNWWLGGHNGGALQWSLAGNTRGFGQIWDGRPFWQGRFSASDRDSLLFYYPGDGKYWSGTWRNGELSWRTFGDF